MKRSPNTVLARAEAIWREWYRNGVRVSLIAHIYSVPRRRVRSVVHAAR